MSSHLLCILRRLDPNIVLITVFALLNSARVWLLRDVIWDDNCWLQIIYATSGLKEFLDLGFVELRREPLGIALYPLLSLHKTSSLFYAAWHSLNMLTEIASPIFVYVFVTNLTGHHRRIGLLAALAFTGLHLDHTLGYASAMNYRMGLLLSLLSLYLTERGVAGERVRISYLAGALFATWIGNFVFMEAMVAIEPARLLLIGYLLSRRVLSRRELAHKTFSIAMPFLLLGIMLIFYKLMFKPFGLYDGAYAHHFQWQLVGRNLASLLYFERRELLQALHYWSAGSVGAGLVAGLLGVWVGVRLSSTATSQDQTPRPLPATSWYRTFRTLLDTHRPPLMIGLALLVFPLVLLIYADRALGGNMNSSHAAPLQIGWSMIAGTVLWASYATLFEKPGFGKPLGIVLIASLLGLGTFANNKYLDLYLQSWNAQSNFWRIFQARIPRLPDGTVVFFDVDDGAEFSDLRIYYDFEFQMNLAYGTEVGTESFHRYRAYTMEESRRLAGRKAADDGSIDRETHFGKERLNAHDMLVVRYRPGEFLVNREILAAYPTIEYRDWLDKDVPAPLPAAIYPLRQRLEDPP